MKVIIIKVIQVSTLYLLFSLSFLVKAQEKTTEAEINIPKNDNYSWYTSPWVWIIGSIIFVSLLIAVLRRSEKRN